MAHHLSPENKHSNSSEGRKDHTGEQAKVKEVRCEEFAAFASSENLSSPLHVPTPPPVPATPISQFGTLPEHLTPVLRPRRLRTTPVMRNLVAQTRMTPGQLVLPAFVRDGIDTPHEILSMPGVFHHSLDSIRKLAVDAVEAGIGAIDLFGIPREEDKDPYGSAAWDDKGILNRAIAAVRAEVGDDLIVCADTCLDEFTDHGHCGVVRKDGVIDNDSTVALYCQMALTQAQAGAHMVSPSGMMDGQVAAIRDTLDENGLSETALMAYSAKYASAFFGPFREAVQCSLQGDRATYQQDPRNRREGVYEALLDEAEGADIVMVKPAGYYLDVVTEVAQTSELPVAAYQVSGEYSMIEAACAKGWLDRRRTIMESVHCIVRAGADIVLTYWAIEIANWLRDTGMTNRN
ncbi:MAG: porphobilinogen synthase [Actinomycetaceae bacterium]|nr:porphobilinogen synthase [Actinomycetaceae bacterium]